MRQALITRKTLIPFNPATKTPARWCTTEEHVTFHDFAMDYDELDKGIAIFPVAIVEHASGIVESVPLSGYTSICFTTPTTIRETHHD